MGLTDPSGALLLRGHELMGRLAGLLKRTDAIGKLANTAPLCGSMSLLDIERHQRLWLQ
jgi:hypothetical protein